MNSYGWRKDCKNTKRREISCRRKARGRDNDSSGGKKLTTLKCQVEVKRTGGKYSEMIALAPNLIDSAERRLIENQRHPMDKPPDSTIRDSYSQGEENCSSSRSTERRGLSIPYSVGASHLSAATNRVLTRGARPRFRFMSISGSETLVICCISTKHRPGSSPWRSSATRPPEREY